MIDRLVGGEADLRDGDGEREVGKDRAFSRNTGVGIQARGTIDRKACRKKVSPKGVDLIGHFEYPAPERTFGTDPEKAVDDDDPGTG